MKQNLSHFIPKNIILATVLTVSYLAVALFPILSRINSANHVFELSPGNSSAPELLMSLSENDEQDPETENIFNSEGTENSTGDVSGPDETEDTEPSLFDFPYPIIIKAINPGYKIDGISDVGELIELQNLSDVPLSLAGFSLRYANSSGKEVTIFEFAEGSLMTGENLLLRYYNKKLSAQVPADAYYETSLAMTAGPLELVAEGIVIDTVCWTGKTGCAKAFKSTTPTTLVRDLASGDFVHQDSYGPIFDSSNPSYYAPFEEDEEDPDGAEEILGAPQCFDLEFTEILSYYDLDQSEQFIELHNPSAAEVILDGCQLRYKKKTYPLSGSIASDGYFAFYPGEQFSLTKNPSSSISIELIDADGAVVEEISYPKGQKKATSYALVYDLDGKETWSISYIPTPGAANIYQPTKVCEAGKVINPLTGNCVKASSVGSSLTVCPEGKYLNPLTGRCKSLTSSTSTPKPCAEGYERNPETNRCRKITSANDGADYALVPSTRSDNKVFIAFGIVALLVSAGVIYIILQYRREIARAVRKIHQRFNRVFQDLLAGKISLHRNKKP